MTDLKKSRLVNRALKLSDFFEIDLTISMFGRVIFSWHFPPRTTNPDDVVDD